MKYFEDPILTVQPFGIEDLSNPDSTIGGGDGNVGGEIFD